MSANDEQVGGNHYKVSTLQPWDVIDQLKMGFFEGNIFKYICRWRLKGGVEDLKKARHYLDKLIEIAERDNYKTPADHFNLSESKQRFKP